MTTPHPTPEERYEAAVDAAADYFSRYPQHGIRAAQRTAFREALREAEAAGEARGRVMERERIKDALDFRLNDYLCEMREGYDDSIVGFNEAWDVVRKYFKSIRARTDKESSDD